MITHSKRDFLELVKNGKPPPLHEEIAYSPPHLIYESLASPNSFLLESMKGPMKIARYSFIGFDPYAIFKVKDGLIEIESSKEKVAVSGKPLYVLKELVASYRQIPSEHLPPFQGGAVGFLSYDFVQYIEKLPSFATDDLNLPDAHFLMIDKLVAFDHHDKKCWIIVCPGARNAGKENLDWSEKYEESEYEINKILKKVSSYKSKVKNQIPPYPPLLKGGEGVVVTPPFNSSLGKEGHRGIKAGRGGIAKIEIDYEMKKDKYMDIVKRAKEYIAAGDIFQANLSQRVSSHIGEINRWSIYRTLSSINPAPFAAFLNFGDYQIVSSSPERLLRVRDGVIETRPIAGTRPRGRDWKEDEFMRAELLLNEKERAEHIMLVDLERNDLGRVSDYGTVKVDELMITEDCSHVIHIVSNVRGRLANGKDCFDAIKAAFPGGTITGVPKIRCMEIIEELEPVKRGPYTGSIGYISFSGNMDWNIIIRTFVVKGERAYVQAGAGIVADSDPEREYYETLKKAEAPIRTLERIR
jgi:anthranilate/para-aminobenzoate synthase component I